MTNREILKRLKTPKLKRLLLTAAATSLLWGYSCQRQSTAHQKEIEKIRTAFLQKENKYQEEIKLLKIKANKFRFYEYDASGLRVEDIEKLKNAKLEKNPGDEYDRFRLKEPRSADAQKLVDKWHKEYRRFDRRDKEEFEAERDCYMPLLEDSSSFYADERYLQTVRKYRDWVTEKTARAAYRRGESMMRLLDDSDLNLKQKIAELPSLARNEHYGNMPRYRADFERYKLMSEILNMREFVRYNNAMIDDIKLSYRQIFEAGKEVRIEAARDSARKAVKNRNYADEFMKRMNFFMPEKR